MSNCAAKARSFSHLPPTIKPRSPHRLEFSEPRAGHSRSRAQGIQGVLQHRKLLCPGRGTDRQRMCLQPQGAGRSHWVNASPLPPCRFVSTAMQLTMMAAAKWHCVLVADLATECRPLDKAQMMRI